VKLEYKYKVNELRRYKMVMDAMINIKGDLPNMSQIPPISFKYVSVIRYRTKSVLANGDAQIVMAIESMKVDTNGKTMPLPVDKIPVMKMVMTKTGAVKSVDMPKNAGVTGLPMQMSDVTNMQVALLPTGEVKVGDSWIQDVPLPMNLGIIHAISKLVGVNVKLGAYNVAVIDQQVNGDIAYKGPIPGTPSNATGSPNLDLKMNLASKGTSSFSMDKGCLVSTDYSMSGQGALNVQGIPNQQGADAGANPNQGTITMDMQMVGQMYLLPSVK
jgi:hypothetical protein